MNIKKGLRNFLINGAEWNIQSVILLVLSTFCLAAGVFQLVDAHNGEGYFFGGLFIFMGIVLDLLQGKLK